MIHTAHRILFGRTNQSEIGGECGTNGGEEMNIQVFGGEICGKETTWKT